jgi:hypothetical protein
MPAKRVLISVDERILARIDDAARRDGLTRSRFLAEAAIARIDGAGEPTSRPDAGAPAIRSESSYK